MNLIIDVYYWEGEKPHIFRCGGEFVLAQLIQIQRQLDEDWDDLNKGGGNYRYIVRWQPAEWHEGRITIEGYWDFEKIDFEKIKI